MKTIESAKHFIGCDVSKDTLDLALHEKGKDYRIFNHIQVSNNKEGYRNMRKWLRELGLDIKSVCIGMEHTGSYTVEFSRWCYEHKILFTLLHPLDVKNAGARGRNKDDKTDSCFIADYVYTMREKLSPSEPEDPKISKLRMLRNERTLAVKTRTAYINQMKSHTACESDNRFKKMIKMFDQQIKDIEKEILKVIKSDQTLQKNYELLLSLPGIGLVNAVMTIIATGNFTRFQTARQYAKYACVSPLSNKSGTSIDKGNHVSKAGHNEIKAVLTEGARSAIVKDSQLRAYYERKRKEGKTHGCVMNAVKFKLICRMFAVIKRQSPYVETERYRA